MRHPSCPYDPAQCRTTASSYVQQPLIQWTPITDGAGRPVNRDPNVHIVRYSCTTCRMSWEHRRAGDHTHVTDLTPTLLPA